MMRARSAAILTLLAAAWPAYAAALDDPIGIWTFAQPGSSRQCRLQLRADPAATGQAVAMPPGCRRAFPILGNVRSWSVPDGVHLAFNDKIGANVLMFGSSGAGRLTAPGPGGEPAFALTALGARPNPSPAESIRAVAAAAAAVPDHPPATVAGVAGHYAVMRGSRDTGCMVTLDDAGRGAPATLKARLAPACRDQGISIFDPVSWGLKAGRLVLQARKGHTADFVQDATGRWEKEAKGGQPLGLKRL